MFRRASSTSASKLLLDKIISTMMIPDAKEGPIRKDVLQVGDAKTYPRKNSTISIHYTGTIDGKEFDSSVSRGEPFSCIIGVGQVIKGWDLSIPTLSVGEKAVLTIPPEYAYGDHGIPGVIPPKATLTFEVNLLDVSD